MSTRYGQFSVCETYLLYLHFVLCVFLYTERKSVDQILFPEQVLQYSLLLLIDNRLTKNRTKIII